MEVFRAEPQADAHRVHRGVARADDCNAAPGLQRCVEFGEIARAHQVAAREQLVSGEHAVQRLARNAHETRVARARANEHGVKAHLGDHLLDREQPPDQRVALELDAKARELLDLDVDDRIRQPEIRDAVLQHATRLVERLVYGHVAAGLGHVGGTRHAGRARADDADLEPVVLDVRNIHPTFADRHVADPALEAADRDRLQRLADGAHTLALAFLRADAAADGRQQVGIGDDVVRAVIVLVGDLLDEGGNVDAHRAAAHARRVHAHEAALRLVQRFRERIAERDFLEIARADQWILLAHRRALLRDRADGFLLGGCHGALRFGNQSPAPPACEGSGSDVSARAASASLRSRQLSCHFSRAAFSVGRYLPSRAIRSSKSTS